MDVLEIRKARLRMWFPKGKLPQKEKNYFAQLMRGASPFGEKAARRIEEEYEIPHLWLDQPLTDEESTNTENESAASGEADVGPGPAGGSPAELMMVQISVDEINLVSLYRAATPLGKSLIMTTAKNARKAPATR